VQIKLPDNGDVLAELLEAPWIPAECKQQPFSQLFSCVKV